MKLQIFIGLVVLGMSSARVIREAPKPEEHFQMENFLETFQAGLKEIERIALDVSGAASTDELKQKASENFETITQQFKQFTDNIKTQAENLKDNEMVKDLRETVDKSIGGLKEQADQHIAKFKEEHPETYKQVATYVENVKNASSTIGNKIENLAQSEDTKKLKETSLKFVDELKETFMDLAKDLKPIDGEKHE